MTKSKALTLAFSIYGLLIVVTFIGLTVVNAGDSVLVAALLLIASAAAYILSAIVIHYAPPEE